MGRILVVLAMVPALARATDLSTGTVALRGSSTLDLSWSQSKLSGFSSSTTTKSINVQGTTLYYLLPNLAAGVDLGYSNFEATGGGSRNSGWSLSVGPALEVDHPVAEQVAFFVQGAVGYVASKANTTSTATGSFSQKLTGFSAGLIAGVKYFVVNAFSLDAGLVYDYEELRGERNVFGSTPGVTSSRVALNGGLSVYFR